MTGYVAAIGDLALRNTFFREVLFTAGHAQLVETCPDEYRAWVLAFLAHSLP